MLELIGRTALRKLAIATGRRLKQVQFRGLPRLMYWSGALVSPRGVNTIETVSGLSFPLDLSDYASCMMFYGIFSSALVRLLSRLIKAGDSVIDVGAQLGYISSHMARLVGPNGYVHSFEPDPNALSRLRATVSSNGHYWIKIFPCALGRAEGEIEFYVSPTIGWSTAVRDTHLQELTSVQVHCTSLDRLMVAGEIRRPVSLVKLDVEGYECAVLDGMQRLMSEDRPIIIAEVNPVLLAANHQTPRDLLATICRYDYHPYRIDPARGLLQRGEFDLASVDDSKGFVFCDIVCIPDGKELPAA